MLGRGKWWKLPLDHRADVGSVALSQERQVEAIPCGFYVLKSRDLRALRFVAGVLVASPDPLSNGRVFRPSKIEDITCLNCYILSWYLSCFVRSVGSPMVD